ncbi:MAG: hypothetical protein K6F72_00110 [Bacteroidales bacterium]|nr:hypothetical protein [Bacteroidales bacterium]
MENAKDIITAARVTNVGLLESLNEDYYPNGVLFSLFLAPKSDSSVEIGDIKEITAMLPHSNGEYVEVPVVVGDWSPVVFHALKADNDLLTDVKVYVAPIKDIIL